MPGRIPIIPVILIGLTGFAIGCATPGPQPDVLATIEAWATAQPTPTAFVLPEHDHTIPTLPAHDHTLPEHQHTLPEHQHSLVEHHHQDPFPGVIMDITTRKSLVFVETSDGISTGFVVNLRGGVLTSAHAVGDDRTACVGIVGYRCSPANGTVVALDPDPVVDLAYIKVDDPRGMKPMELASGVRMGQAVLLAAAPRDWTTTGIYTRGMVSWVDPDDRNLMADTHTAPGFSGAPLLNHRGEVLGMHLGRAEEQRGGLTVSTGVTRIREFLDQHDIPY